MDELRKLAIAKKFVPRQTTTNGTIEVESLKIHFRCPQLKQLLELNQSFATLRSTYLAKPVVTVGDEILFGELAILRYLEKDDWEGVWVDSFHSSKNQDVFWSAMPPEGKAPSFPSRVQERFNEIKSKNNGRISGFFDVFAWKNEGQNYKDDYVFIEYKGRGDSPNDNEDPWVDAATSAGVEPNQLFIVHY